MPKTGSKVQSCKDSRSSSSNLGNTFLHIFHRILIHISIGIQRTEILHHSLSTVFLFHQEDRAVVPAAGRLNDSQSQPFSNLVLQIMLMSLRNFKLLNINGFFSFHEEFMKNGIAVSDIVFAETEDLPMLSQKPSVVVLEFGRYF